MQAYRRAFLFLCLIVLGFWGVGCKPSSESLVSRSQTFAELRTIKRGVFVAPPGEKEREPYARERLVDGEAMRLDAGALAWLRRDGGATILVAGPARLRLRATSLEVSEGRVFVDTPAGVTLELATPRGQLHLAAVRASLEVADKGAVGAYVLRGAVRADGGIQAGPGERLVFEADGTVAKAPVTAWEDWTGGLATTDRSAEPAPFGIGTVGARKPGDRGEPRFPLAIERLDVRVTIEGEFATTEVDEVFANPTSDTVEGIFAFRTPEGATLGRFGVDRDGELVWGRVKEKHAAAAQYQANVYEGSREDPALLEWDAPGVFKARLYPIQPRETRRVVTRYSEWLGRHGPRGERRLYVYPMAAEGAEGTLPRIEELTVTLNLERAGAKDVRVGMNGKQEGQTVTVKAYDFVPRADLAVELLDDGPGVLTAYRADHVVDRETTPADQLDKVVKAAETEAPYLLVPVRATRPIEPAGGLDLAIVVDTSAATETASLAIARAVTGALLAHLGPEDRAAVWAGDATLRAVADGSDGFAVVDAGRREAIATGLAQIDRGGATDLGALLSEAASRLDVARRGAVVYIGDGQPTVGELGIPELRERLGRLPRPVRLFGIGVGDGANLALLSGIARGGFATRVGDAHAAARAALGVLEQAERPVWLGASVDLGAGIDRVFPRELGTLASHESVLVVGRIVGPVPTEVVLRSSSGEVTQALSVRALGDGGDLRRRWAEGRLAQLLEDDAGRAAVVEVGVQSGIITPFTSLYVPTAAEHEEEILKAMVAASSGGPGSWWSWLWGGGRSERYELQRYAEVASAPAEEVADNEEGGSGTRAEDDEGLMGKAAAPRAAHKRYAVQGPADSDEPHAARQQAMREAQEFGMIGLTNPGAAGDPGAPTAPWGRDTAPAKEVDPSSAMGNVWGDTLGDAPGAGGLGLSGMGMAGGGAGAAEPAPPPASVTGTGQGFGSGHGRLGGAHRAKTPVLRTGTVQIEPGPPRARRDAKPASRTPDDASPGATPPVLPATLGAIGHAPAPCPPSADLPFEERRVLWRERLAGAGGDVDRVAEIYFVALRQCEAPTWRERSQLLVIAVDALPGVRPRVELWRRFLRHGPVADAIYRILTTRVRTADDIRELHDALGIRQLDRSVLERALAGKKTPEDRARLLGDLVRQWPDDIELALRLLDALEDAGDDGAGRALARKLRRRADATTRVRTAVGEYTMRLGARAKGAAAGRDAIEARRTFGEIVEFAPDDPWARRLLGDLLRAHGWYEEALRQYETLARLAPDDTSVPLLLAAASQGMGRTEEAIRWTEKAAGTGAPDPTSALSKTSRSIASAFLAWARDEAARAGRTEEAERLRERARRLTAVDLPDGGASRLILTWAHPELHPELWSSALGAPMPAPDGDAALGVAQAVLPRALTDAFVEVHLGREDAERAARLGAEAILTAIFDEGTDTEKIVRLPIRFARIDGKVVEKRRFRLDGSALREELL
jgi:tetratricopeptide (TPR) repeat protein